MLVEIGGRVVFSGFKFAVFENGEADVAIDHSGEVSGDSLCDGRGWLNRVVGVGVRKMRGLGSLEHLHPGGGFFIAAGVLAVG